MFVGSRMTLVSERFMSMRMNADWTGMRTFIGHSCVRFHADRSFTASEEMA
jgi:hypothetical protein